MKAAGLRAAAFGRGVKPIGFDNQVLEQSEEAYSSQFSEMWWEGPDGTKILGILFANWYSNGNEIPAEKTAALDFWNQKLADVEKFAIGFTPRPKAAALSPAAFIICGVWPIFPKVSGKYPNSTGAPQRSDSLRPTTC